METFRSEVDISRRNACKSYKSFNPNGSEV